MSPASVASVAPSFATAGRRIRVLEIVISLLLGAGFFVLLRATPDLPGGTDGYRHVTQAWRLINEPKAMFADPWHLAYLWHKPVDPWFGFHVMLAPFVYLFDRITAIKLLSSVIFGGIAYVMFLLLRHLESNHRIFWVMLAMTGSSMTLGRATTVRPFLLSVLLTLLATLFTLTGKPVKLAFISMLHALSYSIFFLVGMAPFLWFLLRRDRRSAKAALYCVAGLGLGLLANPYFPENVRFDLLQASVVTIARAAHVKIAGELAAAGSWWWLAACFPAVLPWIGALAVRLSKWRTIPTTPVTNLLLIISATMFFETLHIVRTADFFIPFAILFAAAVLTPYLPSARRDLAIVGLLFAIPCAVNIYLAREYVIAAPVLERFRGASTYLRVNAPEALIVNTGWAPDYFFLFYFNSKSRYVIGIEPTFLYLNDPHKYWLWRHINDDDPATCDHERCAGSERIDIVTASSKGLGGQYIVTDHENSPRVDTALRANPGATEVYRDAAMSVYRIAP